MTTNQSSIQVIAAVQKVQTLADGGLRWTFDLPESAILQSAQLMEIRRSQTAVELTIEPVKDKPKMTAEYGGRLK